MTGDMLYRLYAVKKGFARRVVLRAVEWLEGGQMQSETLRRIFADYHDIHVGRYSYGGCFDAERIARGTRIGAYCSFASGVHVFSGNHPYRFRSQHPYFYNPALGIVDTEAITRTQLTVGNDVWVGCNAIILPGVRTVGDGAVIGAGAVVTKDVPPFAIAGGNPARVIKYRFSPKTIEKITASRWWEKSVEELKSDLGEFTRPVE